MRTQEYDNTKLFNDLNIPQNMKKRNNRITINTNISHMRNISGCSNISSITCATHRSNISGLTTSIHEDEYEYDKILKGAKLIKAQLLKRHEHRRSISSISIDIHDKHLDILHDIQAFQKQHALSYLDKDDAYKHTRCAGLLWQSLVGEFVRFPKEWFGGKSRVPLDIDIKSPWKYVCRESYTDHPSLLSIIKHHTSRGRLLLHVMIVDSSACIMDIVIGCYHPLPQDKVTSTCRYLWMAIRHRSSQINHPIESLISPNIDDSMISPIIGGTKKDVNNSNIRSIFGDKPPLHTVRIPQSTLMDVLRSKYCIHESKSKITPAMTLLCEFVHRK